MSLGFSSFFYITTIFNQIRWLKYKMLESLDFGIKNE